MNKLFVVGEPNAKTRTTNKKERQASLALQQKMRITVNERGEIAREKLR